MVKAIEKRIRVVRKERKSAPLDKKSFGECTID